jgi:hypothetical protein
VQDDRRLAVTLPADLPEDAVALADIEHPCLVRLDRRVELRHRSTILIRRSDSSVSYLSTNGRTERRPALDRQRAQNGTYALVVLDTQNAGSGALGPGALGVVLCGSGSTTSSEPALALGQPAFDGTLIRVCVSIWGDGSV